MRFSRYAMIGGTCAILTNSLIIFFLSIGFNYFISTWLAFVPVLLVGYALHTVFTFKTPASWKYFARYTVSLIGNTPAWFLFLYIFCTVLSVPALLAVPFCTVLLFFFNYLLAGWALSATSDRPSGPAGKMPRLGAQIQLIRAYHR